MRHKKRINWMVIAFIIGMVGSLIVNPLPAQQEIKASLFKDADKALEAAKEVNADVLAPKNFEEAMKYFKDADQDFQKGKNLEDIRMKLTASVNFFRNATEAAKLAEATLVNSLKARNDAKQAGAPEYAVKIWTEAETKFTNATRELEAGAAAEAKKRAGAAETLYRQAELEAVKVNYLNETWELLKQADETDVKKYAPKTLLNSQNLIKQADKELNENRYDTDLARSLARQAKYEAQHALYLAKIIKDLRDNRDKLEDYLLSTEVPLAKIAETMDIVGSFETGFEKTTNDVVDYTRNLAERAAKLDQELTDSQQQIELLNSRVAEMEENLGGLEKEKSALAMQMAAQAKVREQFAAVEKMFDREEANVLRKGNDVIVRLTGLSFPVGKATIESQNFALLTKVQKAIDQFSDCVISIEGHTDSYGSDEQNMELSQQRADAVTQYLLANMGIDASRFNAVGYGEDRPIASNDTMDGRAKNRRIEVVIHPNL